jgi:hypothetical protein
MDFLKKLISSPPAPSPPEAAVVVVKPVHPYYPTEIEILNFVANDMTVPQLLATFAAGCTVILGLTWFLASSFAPRLKKTDKLTALWFCLCMESLVFAKRWILMCSRRLHSPLLRGLFRL